MIGLGVGIDYALFVVTRYRQGLAEGGTRATRWPCRWPRRAGPWCSPGPRSSCRCSACSSCSSLHAGPGHRRHRRRGAGHAGRRSPCSRPCSASRAGPSTSWPSPGLLQSGAEPDERGFWYRWSRTVQRHPCCHRVVAVIVLVLLALPMFSMRLAFTDAGNDPPPPPPARPSTPWPPGSGPGFNGPLVIVATCPPARRPPSSALDAAVRPRRRGVRHARRSSTPSGTRRSSWPTRPRRPRRPRPRRSSTRCANEVIPAATAGTGVRAYVGGETAGSVDAATYLSTGCPG